MEIKLRDDLTGHWYTTCQFYKCKRKAFKKFIGIVHCRKCYKQHLVRTYGSLKKASKYLLN